MNKNLVLKKIRLRLVVPLVLITIGWAAIGSASTIQALANNVQAKAPAQTENGAVLTVMLRGNVGQPLSGVLCEVLSYDWGVPRGKPYATIAQGETDRHGAVAFNMAPWPHSSYRFRFTRTDHTLPAEAYFLPPEQNQFRGFPSAVLGGGTTPQLEYFVIGGDGIAYNDLASGQGVPVVEKNPEGGLTLPHVSPQDMSSRNYLATARAATATAYAQGIPTLTPPPPPSPFGGVQAALPLPLPLPLPLSNNPVPAQGSAQPQPTSFPETGTARAGAGAGVTTFTPGATRTAAGAGAVGVWGSEAGIGLGIETQSQSQGSKSDLATSVLLALFGVGSFILFWKNRRRIYGWLGVDTTALTVSSKSKAKRRKSLGRGLSKTGTGTGQSSFAREQARAKAKVLKPEAVSTVAQLNTAKDESEGASKNEAQEGTQTHA